MQAAVKKKPLQFLILISHISDEHKQTLNAKTTASHTVEIIHKDGNHSFHRKTDASKFLTWC